MFLFSFAVLSVCHALSLSQRDALLRVAPHRFTAANVADACDSEWLKCSTNDDPLGLDMQQSERASLPSEIAVLDTLERLSFGRSDIENLPSQLASMTNLARLDMTRSKLKFFPTQVFTLTNLVSLRLPNMKTLTGSIPTQIGQLTALTELNLGTNQLSGEIPSQVALLSDLERFYCDRNFLHGSLPKEFAELKKLEEVRLHWNPLSGVFPNISATFLTRCDITFVPNDVTASTGVEYVSQPCWTSCLASKICCENVTTVRECFNTSSITTTTTTTTKSISSMQFSTSSLAISPDPPETQFPFIPVLIGGIFVLFLCIGCAFLLCAKPKNDKKTSASNIEIEINGTSMYQRFETKNTHETQYQPIDISSTNNIYDTGNL